MDWVRAAGHRVQAIRVPSNNNHAQLWGIKLSNPESDLQCGDGGDADALPRVGEEGEKLGSRLTSEGSFRVANELKSHFMIVEKWKGEAPE